MLHKAQSEPYGRRMLIPSSYVLHPCSRQARLRLREYQPSDEAFFLQLFNDYDVSPQHLLTYIAPSTTRALDVVAALNRIPVFVVAESKETGAAVGFANITIPAPQNLDGTFGIAVAESWQGQGYGTEIMSGSFRTHSECWGLRRVTLQVFSSNTGAIALYERVYVLHTPLYSFSWSEYCYGSGF